MVKNWLSICTTGATTLAANAGDAQAGANPGKVRG